MEQRIGSNNQPLAAAAVDPSHIPGLTAPVSVKKEKQEEPEDIKPTEPVEPDEAAPEQDEKSATEKTSLDKTSAEADAEDEAESDAEAEDTADADDAPDADEGDDDAEDTAEGATEETAEETADDTADDGPVFEASDRRAKIVADSSGVRLRLDDQECEFRWDEIGAIETESPRFGKRFTVTVHTPDRRWYPIEIEAKAKSEHAAWETQIDEVLDAYFEDGEEPKTEEPVEESVDESAESEESAP